MKIAAFIIYAVLSIFIGIGFNIKLLEKCGTTRVVDWVAAPVAWPLLAAAIYGARLVEPTNGVTCGSRQARP